MISAEPFKIRIPQEPLDDLNERLLRTRWPGEPENAGWRYGANLGYMKKLVDYWVNQYDWREWESKLNRFPQYIAGLGDYRIHFVYEKGSGERALPLLITHGWPGSIFEFYEIIEPLAHPERFGGNVADAFDVVCPTLPGYGFSSAPRSPIGPREIAPLWHRLMTESLGYKRFVAQGGDWGSIVTSWLAFDFPKSVAAIHLNMLALKPHIADQSTLTDEEKAWIGRTRKRLSREGGYQAIQGTKPQTLAYGLTDSPLGLAAWIIEKFHGWPGAPEEVPPPFSMDWLITNVMIYWLTGSINTANWLYYSVKNNDGISLGPGERVETPTGFAFFPKDLFPIPPRSWVERAYNVTHRTDFSEGGHFAALERGADLIGEVRTFFRQFRAGW
ncbi:MAG TPA: epoxide hydrolase [Blastocatellia bacterium]|nr:epoxide hydrolase [Blastocatellia bacterium]